MKSKVLPLFLISLGLILSGCNTWSGFGKDMQKVGSKVEQQGEKVNH